MPRTVAEARNELEVWQNVTPGAKWYVCYDRQGREITKVVGGGKTFVISVFERQINQDMASSPEADLFRNGTFVLKKESEETDPAEIESPDSLTDSEVEAIAREITHGDLTAADAIRKINSVLTLGRIYEALVMEDAPKSAIDTVKAKIAELDPSRPAERELIVSTSGSAVRREDEE